MSGEHATPYTELSIIILPALAHEGVTEDEFEFAVGPLDFKRVRRALIDAVNEGFPDAEPVGKAVEEAQAPASPGATSTTTPPSDLAEAMTSSGT